MDAQLVKSETSLELKRVFQAPLARLYRSWIEPEMMNGWFHPGPDMKSVCTVDLRVGGRYEIQMHGPDQTYVVGGVYQEIVPNQKLVFTWQWQGEDASEESLVTVLFRAINETETELTLRHERFSSEEGRDNHALGWQGTFDRLAEALA